MKRIITWCFCLVLLCGSVVRAKEEPTELYAQSAVLMDADTGRILFEKGGLEVKPMASTTKIMTCILALEYAERDEVVTASDAAAKQPKVHLGMSSGEQFKLEDLLYSLMLESHNDSAVAIAEHIGGSVEGFAGLMNEKAAVLNCNDTHFVTPNGLDGADEGGVHATTAADLARIMRYCIKESPQKEMFLEITRKSSHSFSDVENKRQFSCNNHNAFLGMMEGALSGKTGFTNDAGYCYVGALEREGKTFIVALLACGWPNNKGYKWKDTKALMTYGLEHYEYQDVFEEKELPPVRVIEGIPGNGNLSEDAFVDISLALSDQEREFKLLLREDEQVEITYQIPDSLAAPVQQGDEIGMVVYSLNDEVLKEIPVQTTERMEQIDFRWCMNHVRDLFLLCTR